ncbi:MAG: hypothetical protein ACRCSN_17255 [Dermatophilaceae bacterium]
MITAGLALLAWIATGTVANALELLGVVAVLATAGFGWALVRAYRDAR